MSKRRYKLYLATFISSLSLLTCGCGEKDFVIDTGSYETSIELSDGSEETKPTESLESAPEEEKPKIPRVNKILMIKATDAVNVRREVIDGEILSVLRVGDTLPVLETLTNGWYAVEYGFGVAYVSGEYVEETYEYELEEELLGTYYTNQDTTVIVPRYANVDNIEYETEVSKNQFVKMYGDIEDKYLVEVNGLVCLIDKQAVSLLEGNYAIVDISRQTITIYQDTNVLIDTPVVTGKPRTPSDQGLFKIYDISFNRYLIGPGYKSYVNVMLAYNGGEGLHDAEYFTEENGFRHGWRNLDEFGGATYLTNGSHGCINMPHDAAIEASKILTYGDYVLVQK